MRPFRAQICLALFLLAAAAGCGGSSSQTAAKKLSGPKWDHRVLQTVCPGSRRFFLTAALPEERPDSLPDVSFVDTPCAGVRLTGVVKAKRFFTSRLGWILVQTRKHGPRWLRVAPHSFPAVDWTAVQAVRLPQPVRDRIYFDGHLLLSNLCGPLSGGGRVIWTRPPLIPGKPGTRKLALVKPAACRRVKVLGHIPLVEPLTPDAAETYYPGVVRVSVAGPKRLEGWAIIGLNDELIRRQVGRTPKLDVKRLDHTGLPDLSLRVVHVPQRGEQCVESGYGVEIQNLGDAATPSSAIFLDFKSKYESTGLPFNGHFRANVLRPIEPGEAARITLGDDSQYTVDGRDEIRESNEANNGLYLAKTGLICSSFPDQ